MIELESYTLYKILKNKDTELFSKLSASFFSGYNLALFKKLENYYTVHQTLCSLDEFTNLKKDIVIDNYGTYNEVAARLTGWQKWYEEQKKIFNGIK